MQNTLKCNEQQRIWVEKTFKIEIQKGDQIIHVFFIIGSSEEIKPPQLIQLFCKIGLPLHLWKLGTLFSLMEFQKTGEN